MSGMTKSHTTPYHPMGNWCIELFNRTLISMQRTLEEEQKRNWKIFVPQLVHAYNCTQHHNTGLSPYFLMYGRQPRLAADVLLDLQFPGSGTRCQTEYAKDLKKNGWKPRTMWPRKSWKRQHPLPREIMTSGCVEHFQKKEILSWSDCLVSTNWPTSGNLNHTGLWRNLIHKCLYTWFTDVMVLGIMGLWTGTCCFHYHYPCQRPWWAGTGRSFVDDVTQKRVTRAAPAVRDEDSDDSDEEHYVQVEDPGSFMGTRNEDRGDMSTVSEDSDLQSGVPQGAQE